MLITANHRPSTSLPLSLNFSTDHSNIWNLLRLYNLPIAIKPNGTSRAATTTTTGNGIVSAGDLCDEWCFSSQRNNPTI
jgi:hypothetical protein